MLLFPFASKPSAQPPDPSQIPEPQIAYALHAVWDTDLTDSDPSACTTSGTVAIPFKICLLDAPTGFHRPLTVSALLSSDAFIIPVDPSPLSVAGLVTFLNALEELRDRYGKEPKFLGVVLNMAEQRTLVTQRIQRLLERLLGEERILGVIPKRTRIRELALTRKIPEDEAVLEGLEVLVKTILRG